MQRWPGLIPTRFVVFRFWYMDSYFARANAGFDLFDDELMNDRRSNSTLNASDFIIDIREYDVPYHVRTAIDNGRSHPLYLDSLLRLMIRRYPHWEMVHR
jgi:hypothetical protein